MKKILLVLAVVGVFAADAAFSVSPNASKHKIHLYLLIGRSDMAERDVVKTPIQRYGTLDDAGNWINGTVANTLADSLVSSGPVHRVAILPCAEKGSDPKRWQPGGDLYAATLAKARKAMAASLPTAIVWLPDDADSDDSTALLATLSQMRKDLDFGEVKIAVGEYDGASLGKAIGEKLPNVVGVPMKRGDTVGNFETLADLLKGSVDATVTHLKSPFRAQADGREIHVDAARLSAFPMNQPWPGYQRPLDQTMIGYFASFPVGNRPVEFALEMKDGGEGVPKDLRIRPLGVEHKTRIEGKRLVITVTRPEQFVVEWGVKGPQFHVFANPPFKYRHVPDEIYFGPGEHDVGVIAPKSGQTVCIDEGAVVYGSIHCYRVKDVKIVGRGILDSSKHHRGDRKAKVYAFAKANGFDDDATARAPCCFTANASTNVAVEGVVFRDSPRWTLLVWRDSTRITFDNVKVIGQWRYCSDGLDVWGCREVGVRNSFVRSFDDCIVARGVPKRITGDFLVKDSVLWCDWGKNLEIISDGGDCDFANIVFSNNKLVEVNASGCTLSVAGARAGKFRNILYKDSEIDVCGPRWTSQLQQQAGEKFGFRERFGCCAANLYAKPAKNWNGELLPAYPDGRTLKLANVRVDGIRVYGDKRKVYARLSSQTDYQDFYDVVFTNLDNCIQQMIRLPKEKTDAEKMGATEMNRIGKAAYEEGGSGGKYRVLIYGNSIIKHRPSPAIGWTNDWGMAASCREKDFAHLLLKKFEGMKGSAPDYRLRSLYWLEKDYPNFSVTGELRDDIAFSPDYVIIAIGENANVPTRDTAAQALFQKRLEELARAFQAGGRKPCIVFRTTFWENKLKTRLISAAAKATGSLVVDAGPLGNDPTNKALGLFKHAGVAGHPGDKGMAAIADLIFSEISKSCSR